MRLPRWLSRKEPTCNKETQVQPLGQEDSLGKVTAARCRIPSWKVPWTHGFAGHPAKLLGCKSCTQLSDYNCQSVYIHI